MLVASRITLSSLGTYLAGFLEFVWLGQAIRISLWLEQHYEQ